MMGTGEEEEGFDEDDMATAVVVLVKEEKGGFDDNDDKVTALVVPVVLIKDIDDNRPTAKAIAWFPIPETVKRKSIIFPQNSRERGFKTKETMVVDTILFLWLVAVVFQLHHTDRVER
jgi:hypothetical protein